MHFQRRVMKRHAAVAPLLKVAEIMPWRTAIVLFVFVLSVAYSSSTDDKPHDMLFVQNEKSKAYLDFSERQEVPYRKLRHMSGREKRNFVPPGDLSPEDSPWLRPVYAKKPELVVLHDPDRTIVNHAVAGIQQV